MIVDRYLLREITLPVVAITLGLVFVFAIYTSTRYLADATQGRIAADTILALIGLRILIAMEVLLPIGLYLGLISGLGRLYRDQEITAWQAGGLSRARMLWPLLRFAAIVAVLIGMLTLFARPWAYGRIYALEASTEAQMDLSRIDSKRFQSSYNGRVVIYAQKAEPQAHRLQGVFASLAQGKHRLAIRAEQMTQSANNDETPPVLTFEKGWLYRLNPGGTDDQVLHFGTLIWHTQPSSEVVGYKRKAAPSLSLLSSADRQDIAERQWRLSRPVATLFLAMLGIAFARTAPRRGRAANSFISAIVFIFYYNLTGVARTWVEHGLVPVTPGIYWVDALIGALAVGLLFRPGMLHY